MVQVYNTKTLAEDLEGKDIEEVRRDFRRLNSLRSQGLVVVFTGMNRLTVMGAAVDDRYVDEDLSLWIVSGKLADREEMSVLEKFGFVTHRKHLPELNIENDLDVGDGFPPSIDLSFDGPHQRFSLYGCPVSGLGIVICLEDGKAVRDTRY